MGMLYTSGGKEKRLFSSLDATEEVELSSWTHVNNSMS